MKRKDELTGIQQPDQASAMSSTACDIAVSEMTGWPLDQLCGYIVLTVRHHPNGSHELSIMPMEDDHKWVGLWLDRAAADWKVRR